MPSWLRVFPIWYFFFSVALSESRGIFAFRPYSSLCNSFSMLLIHSTFLLWSLCSHILLLLPLVIGISSHILYLLAGWIFFSYFGMSCFVCIVWSYVGIIIIIIIIICIFSFCPRSSSSSSSSSSSFNDRENWSGCYSWQQLPLSVNKYSYKL